MEAGASICSCTVCVLDAVPLLVGLRDRCRKMAPVVGLAPTRTGLKDRALGSLHSRAFDEMAERGGHAPQPVMRIDFLSTESRLACPVHVPLVPTARVALALFRF